MYVTIPKDLDRVKNKVALGLTLRQIVCLAIGGMMGVPVYFMTRDAIGTSNATICMVVVMLPAFFLALYEKDGMPLEQVLMNWARVRYLRPKERHYRRSQRRTRKVYKNTTTVPEKQEVRKERDYLGDKSDGMGVTERKPLYKEKAIKEASKKAREKPKDKTRYVYRGMPSFLMNQEDDTEELIEAEAGSDENNEDYLDKLLDGIS